MSKSDGSMYLGEAVMREVRFDERVSTSSFPEGGHEFRADVISNLRGVRSSLVLLHV